MALSNTTIYQDIVNPGKYQFMGTDFSTGQVYVKSLTPEEYSKLKNLGIQEGRVNNTDFQGIQLNSLEEIKKLATSPVPQSQIQVGYSWDTLTPNQITSAFGSGWQDVLKNRDLFKSADFTKLPTTGATFITPEQAAEYKKTSYGGATGLNAALASQGQPLTTGSLQPQTLATQTGQNVYSQQTSVQQQIQDIQTKLKTSQLQMAALQKYGLKDTNQLTQDAQGNWVPVAQTQQTEAPMPDEFSKYLDEAQAYYEPAKQSEMSELEQQVSTEKQRLTEDWNQYLSDIQTGKVRAGTDYESQLRRQLEQKSQYLQQQEFNIKNNMESLNRNWMQKGGLFSGARLEAGQNYQTQEQMAKQNYLSGVNYNVEQLGTSQARAMEDLGTAQQKGQLAYTRGTEDVALQRIKDVRSLNEKYNTAISTYAGQSGYYDWRKNSYGY